MQNPSVANVEIADKSVQFLEKLIFTKGYSEFRNVKKIIIVNQFAFIKTNDFNGSELHIGQKNDVHILEAIRESGHCAYRLGAEQPLLGTQSSCQHHARRTFRQDSAGNKKSPFKRNVYQLYSGVSYFSL